MTENEENIERSNLEKSKDAVTILLLAIGLVGSVYVLNDNYQDYEKELDLLCGEDRQECMEIKERFCEPMIGAEFGAYCDDRLSYATFTPVPTEQLDERK